MKRLTKSEKNLVNELETKKNSKRITVRLTQQEYQEMNDMSRSQGLSKSDIIRYALAHPNQSHRPAPKPVFTKKDYQTVDIMNDTRIQLARIGNLLNQVVRNENNNKIITQGDQVNTTKYAKMINDNVLQTKNAIRKVVNNNG